ncbi:MAG: NADH-quinone oxidoreductase subunit N [Nibricoccus sp.]
MAFFPELVLLAGTLGLFAVTLNNTKGVAARAGALFVALVTLGASIVTITQNTVLFDGAYRVDAFSQWLKIVISGGYVLTLLLGNNLPDIRSETKAEYFLFQNLSVLGLIMLVSSVEVLSLVIALELSSFPLYLMVAMRREREGQRIQMESAIKYIMFGVAANGIMFFGFSYLFGLTGSTHLPVMFAKLAPIAGTPLAIVALAMAFCGFYYKLAVFPFHFWTPDVYQGASNETAGFIASLPKVGAVAILVRLVSLATPENHAIATLLSVLAILSMCYGNLIALVQTDFKRLLGFSGIAHAGYAVVGFTALGTAGFTAALYYIVGYLLMVTACFVVICRVSKDGTNVAIEELSGLHRRSPLLALTLVVAVFGLAGIPPFVGFIGKFGLLKAALEQHHTALVIITVINSAIAIYYYLQVIRKGVFGEKVEGASEQTISLDWSTKVLCTLLLVGIVWLGVYPGPIMDAISSSLASINLPLPL